MNVVENFVDILDSKFFRTLSEPVRVQILKFLMLNGRSDIGRIAEYLPQDRSVISRHLNLMHETGILTCEKEGRHIYYEIDAVAFRDKMEKIAAETCTCIAECYPGCCQE